MSPRDGQIVTFYSFKGGTGRTMALANVAWILAANGLRVLVADWDLESPGLHRFFEPFLDAEISESPGIVDLIRSYEWAAKNFESVIGKLAEGDEEARKAARDKLGQIIDQKALVGEYAISLNWDFPEGGGLSFLSPGEQTTREYQAAISGLDWENFYNRLHGGLFFDALRANMKRGYDYVLIDSRTGLSDVADICTLHLPDVVVDCFTLSTQGVEGAAMIADMIQDNPHRDRSIRILPVPMRIDQAEKEKADAGRAFAASRFAGLPGGMSDEERRDYWAAVEVPYRVFYAYEEILAVFGDAPGSPTSLLSSYERIAREITDGAVARLPVMDEALREETRRGFARGSLDARRPPSPVREVALDFSPEDQFWAEWVTAVLEGAGIMVRWADEMAEGSGEPGPALPVISLITQAYILRMHEYPPPGHPILAISVSSTRLPPELSEIPPVFLADLPEDEAAGRLLERLDGRRATPTTRSGARYPADRRQQILRMPARNVNFTGREQDLRQLRRELKASGTAVVLPVTLMGLGGVGKTQVALEYAHRFMADYDVIWWMNCGQAQYIDASLADLGKRLREVFGATLPEEGGVAEVASQVLQLLSDARTRQRWLLVYDNADEIPAVQPLLPSGNGHTLITSRNRNWSDEEGSALSVDVFTRAESVLHLRQRRPGIAEEEAEEVASVLGDLPLAVAAAGAWLAETGFSVPEYLQQLRSRPTLTLSYGQLTDYPGPVTQAWDLSLDRLQDTSKAAARLFDLCSVMAPEISLELIYSKAMAAALAPTDPDVSEPMIIAKLVRQIDRLALMKLDNDAHQIQVHRVVQAIVRERMSDDKIADARREVHKLLVDARPDGEVDDPDTWPRYRQIWPHLTPSGAMWSEQEPVRQLLIDRVRYLRQRTDLERGLRRATEIQNAWEELLAAEPGPEMTESLQKQLLRLRFNMANIVRDLADFDRSQALDEAVLSGQRDLLPPGHPHTLMTASSLAADFRALGEYHRALALDRNTYETWTSEFGDKYAGTLSAANNLAVSLRLTGDFRDALAHDTRTLSRRTSTLGANHPRTLDSGANVARDLLEAGRYSEVVTQMEAVWQQSREALGEDHLATLNARVLLGVAQRSAGHPEPAEEHLDAAREGLTRGFGSESTDALACRLSQANNLLALGRVAKAAEEANAVLATYEGRLGPTHPHTLICKVNIASAMCLQEDYPSALAAARPAAEGLEKGLGKTHPYTLAANMVLAVVLARQGTLAEARALETRTAVALESVLGSQHPDTLRCQANMLLTRQEQVPAEDPAERQSVIEKLTAVLGSEHPDIGTLRRGGRLLRVIDPQPF